MKKTAFAPASVGNACVGFDILGFAFDSLGDEVEVEKIAQPEVRIASIEGLPIDLPTDPSMNTAGRALQSLITHKKLDFGFSLRIKKGIPLSSGLGGSAASAAAAVFAANELLADRLSLDELCEFAIEGEKSASGSIHPDNVVPAIKGGMQLTTSLKPLTNLAIPVPEDIRVVLVHPQVEVKTKDARNILGQSVPLASYVRQSAFLSGFIYGCTHADYELIGRSMVDLVIEPQRSKLIPQFEEAKSAAFQAGALGFAISGAGSSVFAWVRASNSPERIQSAMVDAFELGNIRTETWIGPVSTQGARLIS